MPKIYIMEYNIMPMTKSFLKNVHDAFIVIYLKNKQELV